MQAVTRQACTGIALVIAAADTAVGQQPDKAAKPPADGYHILKTFEAGGEGGWDYLTFDPEGQRLFVTRGTHVMVLDAETGKSVGDIADTAGVHGVALAPDQGKGFRSNGRAGTATIFDLKTLKVLGSVKTGENPDAIVYEPATR